MRTSTISCDGCGKRTDHPEGSWSILVGPETGTRSPLDICPGCVGRLLGLDLSGVEGVRIA